MKRISFLVVLLIFVANFYAQNSLSSILSEIEKNNTTLVASRQRVDAQKLGNKTGLTPQNPEVEFNYLWGNPSAIGNRTDFSIRQSFDFPSAYSYKSKIATLKNEQADLEYKKQRSEILLQARLVCIELTYRNAVKLQLAKRLDNAKRVANAYNSKFNAGETSILEFNKAQLTLLNVSNMAESNSLERNALMAELATLNGGKAIPFADSTYVEPTISADFDQWYALAERANPILQWIKQEVAISQKQKQLSVALSLPKLNAGYMSEKVVGEQFQGVSVGMSIPLWENKNTIKQSKANALAMQSAEADTKMQFYNRMKSLHAKAVGMQRNVVDYRKKMLAFNNADLLQKALNKGEISLTEYIFELSLQYESIDNLFEMELNQQKTSAELNQYL